MIELTGKESSQWVVDEKGNKTISFPLYVQKYGASPKTYAVTKYNSKYEADKALRVHLEKQADKILGDLDIKEVVNIPNVTWASGELKEMEDFNDNNF